MSHASACRVVGVERGRPHSRLAWEPGSEKRLPPALSRHSSGTVRLARVRSLGSGQSPHGQNYWASSVAAADARPADTGRHLSEAVSEAEPEEKARTMARRRWVRWVVGTMVVLGTAGVAAAADTTWYTNSWKAAQTHVGFPLRYPPSVFKLKPELIKGSSSASPVALARALGARCGLSGAGPVNGGSGICGLRRRTCRLLAGPVRIKA